MFPIARSEKLLIQEVDEELIVYDDERGTAHCLNQVAAIIWHHCNGLNSIEEIAKLLKEDLDPSNEEDVDWLGITQLSLEELKRFHLITEHYSETITSHSQPAVVPRISRRKAIKATTLVGGFALGFFSPVVKSIMLPTPVMATSPSTPPDVTSLPTPQF